MSKLAKFLIMGPSWVLAGGRRQQGTEHSSGQEHGPAAYVPPADDSYFAGKPDTWEALEAAGTSWEKKLFILQLGINAESSTVNSLEIVNDILCQTYDALKHFRGLGEEAKAFIYGFRNHAYEIRGKIETIIGVAEKEESETSPHPRINKHQSEGKAPTR